MRVTQMVTQNQWFIYLRKGKEKADMELLEEIEKEVKNCANTRKGYYQICKTRYIQFAINNERLRKRGLIFLLGQYEKVHI